MIIEINDKEFLEKEIVVKLSRSELDVEKHKKVVELSKTLSLKGFRKGFIPYSFIVSRFDKDIHGDVLNNLLYNGLLNFLRDKMINFVRFPILKDQKSDVNDFLIFYFNFEIYPVINLCFDNLRIVKYISFVEENDIENEIERLKKLHGFWNLVDVVDFGDKINFSLFNKKKSLYVFSNKEIIVGKDFELINNFLAYVIGKKINVDYKALFFDSNLYDDVEAGDEFIFRINLIERFFNSDLNNSFYDKIGLPAGLDLMSFIKSNLLSIISHISENLFRKNLFDALISNHSFYVPSILLDEKIDELKKINIRKSVDDVSKDVKLDLLIKEIIKNFNINVSKEDVLSLLNDNYKTRVRFDDDIYKRLEYDFYLKRIVDLLSEKVLIEEKKVKFKDLLSLGDIL